MIHQIKKGYIILFFCLFSFIIACGDNSTDPPLNNDISVIPNFNMFGANFYDYNAGFEAVFEEELDIIGQITSDDFFDIYGPKTPYIQGISWDITSAEFWDKLFQYQNQSVAFPKYDFSLNEIEIATIKQHGFVITERHSTNSMAQMYYRILWNDLPVFITSDSILHAWHRSFDAIVEDTETLYLIPKMKATLDSMAESIGDVSRDEGIPIIKDAILDVDVYLAVARSLLQGSIIPSMLGQDDKVKSLFEFVFTETMQQVDLFGKYEYIDFSLFKPRGHYSESVELSRYFRAMTWLGRINLQLANSDPTVNNQFDMAAAIVFNDLMERSGAMPVWESIDTVISVFFGEPDALQPDGLDEFLEQNGINLASDIKDETELNALIDAILAGSLGEQEIASLDHVFENHPAVLPRVFSMIAQRFTFDAWATTKTTATNIDWYGDKVPRYIAHSLDTVFSVFGNNAAVPELVDAMQNDATGLQWRDGLNYQHNLAAARETIDKLSADSWSKNIYSGWISTIRALSTPSVDEIYPEAMRTEAWANKNIETQLASWTQLRHDAILYTKPPVGALGACYYPYGFVEPKIEFWEKLSSMIDTVSALLNELKVIESNMPEFTMLINRQINFITNFSDVISNLENIAKKQLAQKELTENENWYLENVVEIVEDWYWGVTYNGWYPGLFYTSTTDSDTPDALVADVQSAPWSEVYPGHVFIQAVGNINLIVIAVKNGTDRVIYLGPTLSHYEFYLPAGQRLNDEEWQAMITDGEIPVPPTRTQDYLITE